MSSPATDYLILTIAKTPGFATNPDASCAPLTAQTTSSLGQKTQFITSQFHSPAPTNDIRSMACLQLHFAAYAGQMGQSLHERINGH